MRVWNKLKNLYNWISSQLTLRRKGYLYILFLFAFIILTYYYRDSYLFEVCVTLFSIAIVYLVMQASNIELREITEKQIKAFVDSIQIVCSELQNVSSRLDTLTIVMKDVKQTMLDSKLASETAVAKAEEEKRKRKESIRPQLSVIIEPRGFPGIFGFLDLRHYFLTIWNSGSNALGTIVQIDNRQFQEAYNIGTFKQIDIDIGHINDFKRISSLNVLVKTRDVDKNPYYGNIQVTIPQPQPILIPLVET